MYQPATCSASILRRDPNAKNDRGDPAGIFDVVATGLPASVVETSRRTWDRATQTPRTVRVLSGLLGSGTDVRKGDRLRDDTNGGLLYEVKVVTQPRSFGYTPDLELDLGRVGAGD
jgi:hypothetical protein